MVIFCLSSARPSTVSVRPLTLSKFFKAIEAVCPELGKNVACFKQISFHRNHNTFINTHNSHMDSNESILLLG